MACRRLVYRKTQFFCHKYYSGDLTKKLNILINIITLSQTDQLIFTRSKRNGEIWCYAGFLYNKMTNKDGIVRWRGIFRSCISALTTSYELDLIHVKKHYHDADYAKCNSIIAIKKIYS